ncbi:hypothetical protein [Namhaeicola litoreus]|uniref:DUF5020 family protein n=1 Tax=Namhaeicola litoreus TaxID=1052145 RepID=A0ABW3Y3I8_9FLAO
MKKIVFLILGFYFIWNKPAFAQDENTISGSTWSHDIEGWLYLVPDQVVFSPVYILDKGWLHMEARYNYEDLNTFSAWFGYNFSGGNHFKYTFTPMIGGLAGKLNGLSPGLEVDFDFYGFNLNSSSQYVFNFKDRHSDFYYNWTDFTYAPLDWMSFGFSFQRTQLYQNSLELQYGPMIDLGYKWFELSCYYFNPFNNDPYFVLSLSVLLPEP